MNIMKHISLLFLAIFLSFSLFAQVKVNAPGNYFMKQLKEIANHDRLEPSFIQDYDLIRFDGEYHIGVLAMVDVDAINEDELSNLEVINHTRINDIWTFRVPLSSMEAFVQINGLKMIEIAEPVSPYLHENIRDGRVDSVHAGLGGLGQAYKGEGVVIAVIDWGFDYTHPVFYDDELSELRLVRAWDQNKMEGTPPELYGFGAEYIGQDALLIAQHDTDYVFGPGTHGTHVAGIAGGAGGGPDAIFDVPGGENARFVGAAPEAELIFISLRRDAPSLIDGFNYVKDYAESVGKPFVVNMSFGSHLGPHDGTDLKNVGIDNLHGPGRVFVGSAGNNGTGNFHLDRNFAIHSDTLFTVVNIHPSANWGQTLSMWGSSNSSFSASILLVDANNETVHATEFFHSQEEPQIEEITSVGAGELHIRVQSTAAFTTNDKPNIRLEVRNTSGLKIVLRAISDDSHLHIWSNARMQNRYTNWGWGLDPFYPGAVMGNTEYGMGEPAGVGKNVITVGAYRAERVQPNGNVIYGSLANFSSRGPTVDERVKPDITSGGVDVWSAVNSWTTVADNPIEFNGNTYTFDQFSGTSMSGPFVAGIVALMLQADPELSAVDAKAILKATARLDNWTGDIGEEGTLNWGWGKANALAAILATQVLSASDEAVVDNDFVLAFPNPTTDMLYLQMNEVSAGDTQVRIFDLSGKMVKQQQFNYSGSQLAVNMGDMPGGLYLIAVENGGRAAFKKVMLTR